MRFVAAIVVLIPLAGAAWGQEGESRPLGLKVRPSGIDALSDEARERQDRLEARMRRNEFLFRSICRHCSRAEDPFQSSAPFEPLRSLRPGAVPGAD